MNKYKLVKVTWVDSTTPRSGWIVLNDWEGVGSLECISIGYLVDENNNTKTIAPHLAYPDDDERCQASGMMVIPNQAITSIEELTFSSQASQLLQTSSGVCVVAGHSFGHP